VKHYDKIHERTVAKVLNEYVEQGVPADVNIWPLVEQRLTSAHQVAEITINDANAQQPNLRTGRAVESGTANKSRLYGAYNMVRSMGVLMGFIILAVVTAISFAGLSNRLQNETITPTVVTTTPALGPGEGTLLLSIPAGDDEAGYITGDRIHLHGFDVAEDGTFWLVDADNRLLHYSASGERLSATNIDLKANMPLPPANPQVTGEPASPTGTQAKAGYGAIYDLELQGSNIWVSSGGDANVVYKVTPAGNILAEYSPIMTFPSPVQLPEGNRRLVQGGDGQMWVSGAPRIQKDERGISSGCPDNCARTTYAKVKNFDYNNIENVDGFPGKNKLYKAAEGVANVIMAGEQPITITITGTVSGWHIITELPDESFYVSVYTTAKDIAGVPNGPHTYIMHYSAKGELIERAWVPPPDRSVYGAERRVRDLSVGPDGALYDLRGVSFYPGPSTNRLDIVRLDMYPPSEPLPPIPTPTDVPATPVVPTPIPTVPRPNMPLPIPSTTAPLPPTETTVPSPTPIQDLATLAQQSDVIVRAKVDFSDGQTHTQNYSLLPQEWIKNPDRIITDKLSLWILAGRDWGRQIPVPIESVPFEQKSDKEYILFMHRAKERQWDRTPSYYVTDEFADSSGIKFSNAGVFSIRDGKIDFAGIPQYQGWTVDNFVKEIHRFAPTPVAVEKQVSDLSLMGQKSNAIAEVEWLNRPSREVSALGDKRQLSMVKVINWLKGGFKMETLGLMLTQEEHNRLSAGSGQYILFFGTGESEAQTPCDYSLLRYYWPLQAGSVSIFEVRNGHIAYSGVAGYTGYSVDKFKDAMHSAIPTPRPEPTSEWEAYRLGFTDWIHEAQIIARVELAEDFRIDGSTSVLTTTFRVTNWLKKPSGYTGDIIRVTTDMEACTFSLGKGPYLVFLRLDKNAPADAATVGPYYSYGMPMFGIRDGVVEYGTEYQYWGQPIEKLEADINAALP